MARAGRNYIGTYRLLKLIRAGKACQIWEVMRDSDNQRCVLKVLREEYRQNREEIGLLRHEYTVGKDLDHDNVIHVFEFDIARGVAFVALEHFNSLNLKQWLREPEADRNLLESVIEQSAQGLEHLHSHGWIHRDVKPDNLLINEQGEIKLIDFAIAQKMKRGLGRLLSGKGRVQGTRSYMSPEQIRNESLDFRSDIYSFGCFLYELISGKPPYTAGNANELLQRHLTTPVPSVLAADNTVSPEFADLLAQMMAKQREQRPESMTAFLEAFRGIRLPLNRRR